MLHAQEVTASQDAESAMIDICNNLVKKWLTDLNLEEKEIWLWNASVQLAKIKQRRKDPTLQL